MKQLKPKQPKPKYGIEMNKNVVTRFLKRIIADKNILLKVKFFTDKSEWAFGAWAINSKDNTELTVEINRSLSKGRDLRDLLLHEVGHLKGKDNHNLSLVERELSAQLWAINRAKELKWNKRYNSLKWELKHKWTTYFNWNSSYRKYILANKLAANVCSKIKIKIRNLKCKQ